jgi:hypothetical protein
MQFLILYCTREGWEHAVPNTVLGRTRSVVACVRLGGGSCRAGRAVAS